MPDSRTRRARQRRRRALTGGVVAVAAAGTGLGISVAHAQSPASYRTAVVSTSTVDKTLGVAGTLLPITDSTARFQVAGTVAKVDVATGQQVTAGQPIASLETSSLQASVTAAMDTLTSAEAKLTEDELDESSSSSGAPSSQASAAPAAATAAAAAGASYVLTSTSAPPTGTSVAQDQQAVVADQHAADLALEAAAARLAAMQEACTGGQPPAPSTASGGYATTTTSTTTTSTTTPTTVASSSTTAPTPTSAPPSTTVPARGSTAACAAALAAASRAEKHVSTDQASLASAESRLARALAAEAAASSRNSTALPGSSGVTGSGSQRQPAGTGAAPGGAKPSGSPSVSTDTPQQLASDQAAIDDDQARVVEAQQALAAATLVSPVSGTVEAVGLTPGQSVTAGSSSDGITVVDWNSYEVAASLTTTQVTDVRTGQPAQITVTGVTGTLAGTVTRVGPAQESSSVYVYPVIVTVTSPTGQMAAGSDAQLAIDVSRAADTLVVPTSAVHTGTAGSYVYVDKGGTETRQAVRTGVVGDVYTQILSGLSQGQNVVLADPAEAVPSSSTNSLFPRFGPGGAGTFRIGGFAGRGGGFAGGAGPSLGRAAPAGSAPGG